MSDERERLEVEVVSDGECMHESDPRQATQAEEPDPESLAADFAPDELDEEVA